MGYAQGINAKFAGVVESAYGTTPVSGWRSLPVVSTTLGEERPLIEDDVLGFGREGRDPTYDVATNDGDVVVPVDSSEFFFWMGGLLGTPAVTTASGTTTTVYTSGSAVLPSLSLEVGHPEVPSFSTHYGIAVNQMRIGMARGGLLNATFGLIGQGQTVPGNSTVAGSPSAPAGKRFAQATGQIKKGGVVLGGVVSADLTFANALDKVETIRSDGRIEGVLPGPFRAGGSITARFADHTLAAAASDGTPIDLSFGWTSSAGSLLFALPRVFLPVTKRPVEGPRGVMATFAFQASGQGGHQLTATLATPA